MPIFVTMLIEYPLKESISVKVTQCYLSRKEVVICARLYT
jgi:hypothetical protein